MTSHSTNVSALLFGLSDELAGELLKPLAPLCREVRSVSGDLAGHSIPSGAVIFCGPDVSVVSGIRQAKPDAAIVVVSRHAEVSDWLDSIEAGATDYCAAPFESSQVRWILESTRQSARV
jgi:DNA-binding NarL/FixJ family response regulator